MSEYTKITDEVIQEIKFFTGCKPKGGETFVKKIGNFVATEELQLFIPWAAPANGRTELSESDISTLDWLFADNGLVQRFNKFGSATCLIMFADLYAQRNNFDMQSAKQYWNNVSDYVGTAPRYTTATLLNDQNMQIALCEQSYAFDRLLRTQQKPILEASAKYSGEVDKQQIYESAATYSMYRAGEASYVSEVLEALWISLNWPERDIMCGSSPRVYVPEDIRAPWLKDS